MTINKNSISKQVGTSVPLFALYSADEPQKPGSFSAGIAFLNWLSKTHQQAWQLLPLHQTLLEPGSSIKYVSSPYKGYGIGLDPKYLSQTLPKPVPATFDRFASIHHFWLKDYALFCALRDYFGTDNWTKWESPIRHRDRLALKIWQKKLASQINQQSKLQHVLHHQYSLIQKSARKLNIVLIGDLSFYLPLQSPLTWTNQHLFDIPASGRLKHVSGLPDGPKAHFGRQVWGHPLYLWQRPKARSQITNRLFKTRLSYLAYLFDFVRLDHAKGFYYYGSIDKTNPKNDTIKTGPGSSFLKALLHHSQKIGLKIFAEDSGDRIKGLRSTLAKYKISGIRVLRYALTIRKKETVHPTFANIANYPQNSIALTTTHDTETLLAYLKRLNLKQRQLLAFHTKVRFIPNSKAFARELRQAIINSPSFISLIPIQDWLLTTDRINIPGTEKEVNDPNWRYRLKIPVEKLPNIIWSYKG